MGRPKLIFGKKQEISFSSPSAVPQMQAATIIGGVVGVALLLSKFWPNQPQTRPRSTRPDVQLAQPAPPTIPTLVRNLIIIRLRINFLTEEDLVAGFYNLLH